MANIWAPDGLFRAVNQTPGTGIAQAILAAWGATTPLLTMFNSDAAGGRNLYPDYIKLICSVAGASSVSGQLSAIVDTGNRFSSGGSPLTGVNANSGSAATAKATINFGAVTATAATSPRQIGRDTIKTQAAPCWVVGDEVFIKFGNFDNTFGPTNGATTNVYPAPCGPVIVAPQTTLLIYLWNPSNAITPPSWEIEFGWFER